MIDTKFAGMSAICLVLITVLQRLQIKHILCCVAICCSVNLIRPELQQTLTQFKSKYFACRIGTVHRQTRPRFYCSLSRKLHRRFCLCPIVGTRLDCTTRACWQSGRVRHVRTHTDPLCRPQQRATRSGVRTHADIRPLELKSNALTTRPSW